MDGRRRISQQHDQRGDPGTGASKVQGASPMRHPDTVLLEWPPWRKYPAADWDHRIRNGVRGQRGSFGTGARAGAGGFRVSGQGEKETPMMLYNLPRRV